MLHNPTNVLSPPCKTFYPEFYPHQSSTERISGGIRCEGNYHDPSRPDEACAAQMDMATLSGERAEIFLLRMVNVG